jgi:hypothetical protein
LPGRLNMLSPNRLAVSAEKLRTVLDRLDLSKPILKEIYAILYPIVCNALAGGSELPPRLPNRTFFFGMHEHSLPAHFLNETDLLNSIAEFDEALQTR